MSRGRWAAGLTGAVLAVLAAFAQAWGLIGAVWGWADALNHFTPLWIALALFGAGLVLYALPHSLGRSLTLVVVLFVLLAGGVPLASEVARGTTQRVPGPPTLRLLSLNRWWDSPQSQREIATIRNANADLVALQEANGFEASAARLKDLYPYQLFCGGGCDTAILSKRPFTAQGREDHSAWRPGSTDLLWVRTTAADGKPVTLATVHLFWPVPPWIQRGQRARLVADLAGLPRDELVLSGDFNLTPWSFALRSLDRQLLPLTRRSHGLLTFPATWPVPFLALDEVFAGPQWKTVAVRRGPRAGSDHFPVIVELRR